ncbi:MAG: hypothetical protein HFJ59_01510 [Clostridia bacterium]|nr:hypothetical protein [Clostridia bacterium]
MKYITNSKSISGKEVGKISICVFKDTKTGLSSFYLDTDNEDVMQISYVIEDTLKMF